MRKTKRNRKELRHHELKIRMVADDSVDFIKYLLDTKLYKFKKGIRRLFAIMAWIILIMAAILIAVILEDLGVKFIPRMVCIAIMCYIIMKIVVAIDSKVPKISSEEAIASVMRSTFPTYGNKEKNVFYNFGEKGFSTDAKNKEIIRFYEYGAFLRVIECELGLIMIPDEYCIYCIPAKCLDDETACFLVRKFKKNCKRKFITTGKMKIEN